MNALHLITDGVGAPALTFAARVGVGVFFAVAGFHKLVHKKNREQMRRMLIKCHVPCVSFNLWFVSGVEFLAGLGVAFGFLAPLSALGLIGVLLVAICTNGIKQVQKRPAREFAYYVNGVLYIPEVLMLLVLLVVVEHGAGPWSLDAALIQLFAR